MANYMYAQGVPPEIQAPPHRNLLGQSTTASLPVLSLSSILPPPSFHGPCIPARKNWHAFKKCYYVNFLCVFKTAEFGECLYSNNDDICFTPYNMRLRQRKTLRMVSKIKVHNTVRKEGIQNEYMKNCCTQCMINSHAVLLHLFEPSSVEGRVKFESPFRCTISNVSSSNRHIILQRFMLVFPNLS